MLFPMTLKHGNRAADALLKSFFRLNSSIQLNCFAECWILLLVEEVNSKVVYDLVTRTNKLLIQF